MAGKFERGDQRAKTTGQGRGNSDAVGPSWWDVRKLASDLERMYGRRVDILLGPGDTTRPWDSPTMHVRACLSRGGLWAPDTWWASSGFGGSSGYDTLAAAVCCALYDLWDIASHHGMFHDDTVG